MHKHQPKLTMSPITIAVDAMGGDYGPTVTIPSVIEALKKYSFIFFKAQY